MEDQLCSSCQEVFRQELLLIREDNGLPVCEDCSGLLVNENLSCKHDEWG